MKKGQTLTLCMQQAVAADASLSPLLPDIFSNVALACKYIADAIGKGDLAGILGSNESENVQGEVQKKLDVISNDVMVKVLTESGLFAGLASEEMDDPLPGNDSGKFLILFDPLDGSSNIDVNISVGTIFSVLPFAGQGTPTLKDYLQPGKNQIAAGYALYGPSTMLVITFGRGTYGFTLDRGIGEFVLTHPHVQVPMDTKEFAINMSNQRFWQPPMQAYIADCLAGKTGKRGKDFNMRWVASMVAEVHRILNRGGIFSYPADSRDPGKPGRLRLMYEANPMALITEQAGGACHTGELSMLEVQPTELHQRIPVILGSKNEVETAVAYYQG